MINILDKKNCTGCGACCNICPKNCITMTEDSMGFLYPTVDKDKCIGCSLCEKYCPVLNSTRPENANEPAVYAARTQNSDLRFCSTSGGIFSELAYDVIERGGVVCGARYDEDNLVEHCLVENVSGIEKIRQSKYIQSRSGSIYQEIKTLLDDNRLVAFCGTPCQAAGLRKYLRHEYDNLIVMDFICRGVNSPKAFKYWLEEIELKNNSKVKRVWFKYKQDGWKASPRCTRVDFVNGKFEVYSGKSNSFMCGYLGPNLYIRPCCGDCRFKGTPRIGDITLADFWGLNSRLEDDGGTSLVMVNNDKGAAIFKRIQEKIDFEAHDYSEIAAGNVCAACSVIINPKSEKFLESLGSRPFSELVNKYGKPALAVRIIKKLRKVVKRQ